MAKNSNLGQAKAAKNDEFYTQYADIQKEVNAYIEYNPDVFRGKTILLPCDDPEWSNFTKFFAQNFEFFGLKKLISTHYGRSGDTYEMVYEGGNDDNIAIGIKTPLEGNGDFRSAECIELLKKSDIVVTNPPFSLIREYVAQLMEYGKKFLIIGTLNALKYKEIFPLFMNNQIWLGYGFQGGNVSFRVPDNADTSVYSKGIYDEKDRVVKFGNCIWLTNMELVKRCEKIVLWKEYTPEEFPKYENYDAVECSKVANIPMDTDKVIGVPITFLTKYNPEQFEIVGKLSNGMYLSVSLETERY